MRNKTMGLIAGFLLISCVFAFGQQAANQVPFSKGVTFCLWFEGEYIKNAQGISFGKYGEQDFADVKKMGVDVIRLPIDFDRFTSAAPEYTIDPLIFKLLDKVVDWAEKYQIYIILDYQPWMQPPTNINVRNFLLPLWTQMAQHFKDRSEYVIYEIHNEPNGLTASNWGKIQGEAIDAIRKIDQQHWIVVTGSDNQDGYSSVSTLSLLPKYADKKLLYTFHFYLPHLFPFQGISAIDPSFEKMAKIPFPYDKNRMPPLLNEQKGTYAEALYKKYSSEGTTAALTKKIDQAANFMKQRNVPVFCDEFGVYKRYVLPEDRLRWYQFVRETFEARNIPWIMYDYFGTSGLSNEVEGYTDWSTYGDINTDLNLELVNALGFTPVPQKQREPLRSGFTIYDDYTGRGCQLRFNSGQSKVNLYYTQAAAGEYAIQWRDISKNDNLDIDLPMNDFSYLVQNGYVLEFKARTEKPVSFSVGFYHFEDNIQWHNQISNIQIQPDGKWHTIRIPLNSIKELWGGHDNDTGQWYEAKGRAVSWTNVTVMQFFAAHEDGGVREIYLDDIKITR